MPPVTFLPIDSCLPSIIETLHRNPSLVLVAEPGAGKTTRLPPAVMRAGILTPAQPNIVMLQPRRVAARAAAARIAEENDWVLGREVGYHIRFEKKVSPRTRLRILTEGILTRQLLADPFLDGVGMVILDEFHERSLHSDLAVAMLKEMRESVREDLRIVIMSATLDAEKAAGFLGNCPIVRVPGRLFPIDIQYHPCAGHPLIERTADAISEELQTPDGDILVFLPGAEEIRRTARLLSGADASVLPLHGSLSAEEQMAALRPANNRKVILATNIAETSLTIDGVTVVIDSGFARVAAFDPRRGLDRLELKKISQASAAQRAGRAGRTAPGRCVRLWSQKEQADLKEFELPEVKRVDLCSAVLDLHAWGKPDPRKFDWFDAPPEESLAGAERLLNLLGALREGKLTSIGKKLIRLPVHPRVGRLLIAAAEIGCADQGANLAALLSERTLPPPMTDVHADSDLLIRLASNSSWANAQARNELRRLRKNFPTRPRNAPRRKLC